MAAHKLAGGTWAAGPPPSLKVAPISTFAAPLTTRLSPKMQQPSAVAPAIKEETCTRCGVDSWRHQSFKSSIPVPPCQYTACEKIEYFLRRGIVAKVPGFAPYDNQEYLLSNIKQWFKYSMLKSTKDLDHLMTLFPGHIHGELDVFRSNDYVRWLFSVGDGERAMQTIAQHKIAFEEDVVATCIEQKMDAFALQLIRNPIFQLAEVAVVPVQLESRAIFWRMKAEWKENDDPEVDEEFDHFPWEQLPVTKEADRLATISGQALAAAVRRRNFQLTTELLFKGARANDVVWYDDPDAAKMGRSTRCSVSTRSLSRGLFKSIIQDTSSSFDDKKVWVALLAQFGVHLDYQYFSIVFENIDSNREDERLHWLDVGAAYKANAFPHHLIDAMRHPLHLGYVQWWHDHGFPCISKQDIYLQGSTIARLSEESRAMVTRLYGIKFPKRMESHALDLTPTHEVGGECTCSH